ncbi:MAG: 4-vinyl reductase [candidate division KSB1 bacterium]|nr:4-vinyl reductase [candidate division KSB1 bacterium]
MAGNAQEIQKALLSMGLRGDPENGLLRAFGVILAINTVDYLVDRELEYLNVFPKAERMVENSLVDAAQWCANATFGGIMQSKEWASLVEPMIQTRKDRLDGLVAITNCLGWGRIDQIELDEEKQQLKMIVKHSYYVDSYLKRYGRSQKPRCYMWQGVAAGYLDLILGSKVHDFEAKEVKCGCMGDEYCEFHSRPVPKLFDLL